MSRLSNPALHLFVRPKGLSLLIGIPLVFPEASANFGMKSSGNILGGSSSAWMEEDMIQ